MFYRGVPDYVLLITSKTINITYVTFKTPSNNLFYEDFLRKLHFFGENYILNSEIPHFPVQRPCLYTISRDISLLKFLILPGEEISVIFEPI